MLRISRKKRSRLASVIAVIYLLSLSVIPTSTYAEDADDILSGPLTWPTKLDLVTYRDNAFGAHQEALATNKYTIVLFETDLCVFCENLARNLEDQRLMKYASVALISITNGDKDEGARQLEEALGVVRYPTLVVLKTNSENIHVAGRIEGEVSISEIDRVFFKAMREPIAAR